MRRTWSPTLLLWAALLPLTSPFASAAEPHDDWYYPAEEPAERAAIQRPSLREVDAGGALLARSAAGPAVQVKVGGQFDGWRLAQTLSAPEPIAVLDREFDRWGMILFLGREKTVAEVRKAVGRLDKIHGPRLSFPESYAQELMNSKDDLLADRLLAGSRDPTYVSVAALLPPLEDPWSLDTPHDTYTFIGTPEALRKLAVGPDGCIGVRFVSHNRKPLLERVLFDPWQGTTKPTGRIAVKRGLLGGFLPAVNYGCVDPRTRTGRELCALVDRGDAAVALTRVRRSDGRTTFHQIDPPKQLPDGKAFYAALLRLHQSWQTFFERGMQIAIPDRRLADTARAAIVRAMSSYSGLHPKYGLGAYWRKSAEGFPPQTVSLNTCLLDWGFGPDARDRLGYFLDHFVKPDCTIDYYGTAVSDFGQLLEVAVRCARQSPDEPWFDAHRQPIQRIAGHLLKLRTESKRSQSPDAIAYGLLYGSPEADTHKQTDDYCVPAQMTAPLMLRWMLAFEDRDADTLWLCRAVPRAWWQSRVEFRGARTRWGTVSLRLEPGADLRVVAGRIELSGKIPSTLALRVRHPRRLHIDQCEVRGATCEKIDAARELVFLRPAARSIDVRLKFRP